MPESYDNKEVSSITLKFFPGYTYNPITFAVTIDLDQGRVTFKAKAGYGLDDHKGQSYGDYDKSVQSSSSIAKEKCQLLVKAFYESNFFSLKDRYDEVIITDAPYLTISVLTKSEEHKEVLFYGGAPSNLEERTRFLAFFDKIKEITEADKWLNSVFDNKDERTA